MSKKGKTTLIPKLRFPEFHSDGEWQAHSLSGISARITEKVCDKQLTTLSISAGIGFVSQTEKFSRDISGKQYENYICLKKGDFSYNKGNSKKFPQGCIYELKQYDVAAVPNAFISFRFYKDFVPGFYKGYFDNNFHGRQLFKFITSGARSDGLLNINPSDFFSIILPTPPKKKEQKKISDCLSSIDDLINAENTKLELLKKHKKGLLQKMFPADGKKVPEIRFKGYNDDWEQRRLGEFCDIITGKLDANAMVENGEYDFFTSGVQKYKIDTWAFEGPAITIAGNGATVGYMHYADGFFNAYQRTYILQNISADRCFLFEVIGSKLPKKIKEEARMGSIPYIVMDMLTELNIQLPSLPEQTAIGNFFRNLDELITAQTRKIEDLKVHKKGLMQGLFPSVEEVGE